MVTKYELKLVIMAIILPTEAVCSLVGSCVATFTMVPSLFSVGEILVSGSFY